VRAAWVALVGTAAASLGLGMAALGAHDAPAAVYHRALVRDHRRAVAEAQAALPSQPERGAAPLERSASPSPALAAAPSSEASVSPPGASAAPQAGPTAPPAPAPACGAPRCVQIPALGVDAPVLPEGPVGGELTIPPDVHDVGWDQQTAVPGQPGVALLAGHVNWVGQGLGALGGIGQLVPGDLVRLDWGGRVTTWVVSARPQLSPNTEVHPQLFSLSGPPRLALVTCGGPFTETAAGGSYADNVIVWAVPAA
jgi:hypothetical protein